VRKALKRIIILWISVAVFAVDQLREIMRSLLGRTVPPTRVVLCYHSILKEQRKAFARQMDMLVSCSRPWPADVPVNGSPGSLYVSLTFDDGYENFLHSAFPELMKRNIPATIFIVAGALGALPAWKDYSGSVDPAMHQPLLTAPQVRQLPSDLIQIGSHSLTHPMLPQLSELQARTELAVSRTMLERTVGRPVTLFSFPYGSATHELIAWCREEGYQRIFLTYPGTQFSGAKDFIVARVDAEPDDWRLEFFLKLRGAYRWRPYASALKKSVTAIFQMPSDKRCAAMV
jgi:peptidoglycan/xylan/chitin deacetylase (PgdA/CDA1 family)